MKTILIYPLLFLSIFANAQFNPPEIFLELGLAFEEHFEVNYYSKISAGAELFSYKFVSPEIDISFYTGGQVDTRSEFDALGTTEIYKSALNRKFDGFIWGFAPKIYYPLEKHRWVLIPKYNTGTITGKGIFNDSEDVSRESELKEHINFWSFTFGIEGYAWADSHHKFGIYLFYTGLNAGKVLNQLDFENEGYRKSENSSKTIGISVRFNLNFKKRVD